MDQFEAIHTAALANDIEKVRQAIASGADVNAKTESGRTALHYAAHHRNAEMEELLIQEGACKDCPDGEDKLPSDDYANPSGQMQIYTNYEAKALAKPVVPVHHPKCRKRL